MPSGSDSGSAGAVNPVRASIGQDAARRLVLGFRNLFHRLQNIVVNFPKSCACIRCIRI
jgi:hypothetical protein